MVAKRCSSKLVQKSLRNMWGWGTVQTPEIKGEQTDKAALSELAANQETETNAILMQVNL